MNKVIIKNSIFNYIYICIILGGILMIFSGISELNTTEKTMSGFVFFTFTINLIIILSQISKRYILGYSINDMLWIYMLAFFFVAPFIQYSVSIFPLWDTYIFTDNLIIITNLNITLFLSIYIFVYKKTKIKLKSIKKIKNIDNLIAITTIMSIFCSLYLISTVGFNNLFSRSTFEENMTFDAIGLIVSNTVRMFPVITLALQFQYKNIKGNYYSRSILTLSIIVVLVTNFPTALARNTMAAIYIGFIILVFRKIENKYYFKYLIVLGLLFIFPMINIFRENGVENILALQISFPNPTNSFLSGDFDAFSMFSRAIYYVGQNGILYGEQLIGALFFFIPRAIWPSKAIGTGAFLGQEFGWPFTNVSMPYIGEGYINFGIIGIIIFSIILAIFVKKMDLKYINQYKDNNEINYINLSYPFMVGYIFFFLRGDMMSSFAYIIGCILIPIIIMYIIDFVLTQYKRR